MPDRVSYFARDSGCLRRKSASSFRSHSSRMDFGSLAMADALLVEIAIVDDPLRLELGARENAFWHQLDARPHAQPRLQAFAHGLFEAGQVVDRGGVLGAHQQFVHRPRARDDDAELAAEAGDGAQGVL